MPGVGDILDVSLQLFDGDATRFPIAILRDADGSEITGSPATLGHVGNGLYQIKTIAMPDTPFVTGSFEVYDEIAHTTLLDDIYTIGTDTYIKEVADPAVITKLDEILLKLDGLTFGDLITGTIAKNELKGIISDVEDVKGLVKGENIRGEVDDDEVTGGVEDDDEITGQIGDC